ncbi:GNAT family N-acetyltransferase [Chitinolyticbacter albus]|uniref:GNAT family N-acetyltransferase n=1 Tax=Chitinolyticbacter albus TaxID=2961951 RepID=UPI00210A7755|nr:GNAT family N-acetyltransferase [Chitinolyticbacter albus]
MGNAVEGKAGAIRYREACAEDGTAIGLLHTQCWLGYSPDRELANTIVSERLAIWRQRCTRHDPAMRLLLAESGDELVGFACALARRDPEFGSLLDNLHVAKAWQMQGIGSALLREVVTWSAELTPYDGLYLWLLPINRAAQTFYLRRGARELQAADALAAGHTSMLRYGWRRPASLLVKDC